MFRLPRKSQSALATVALVVFAGSLAAQQGAPYPAAIKASDRNGVFIPDAQVPIASAAGDLSEHLNAAMLSPDQPDR
jgi:hypothetical protein